MEVLNRKAKFNYEIEDTYECGIVLTGTEIKSIREGKVNIRDSYGIIKNNEAFILNMHIAKYKEGNNFNHEELRTRKLLLKKKEIKKLAIKVEQEGYTLIPLKLYFKNNLVKILLGVAKGKKLYDKREALKKREIEKDVAKRLKNN